jgi:hypothetical protein
MNDDHVNRMQQKTNLALKIHEKSVGAYPYRTLTQI